MGNSRSSRTLDHPRFSDKRSSGLPTPGLTKKKSRFSFRRSKSKNISLCLDDAYTEPNYDGFVNDFTPKISSHGIQYGVLRIQLNGIDNYVKRVMRYMQFHLKYQIIPSKDTCCMSKTKSNDSSINQWQETKFNHCYITNNPATHFCLRLRSCFSPYKIRLKLTMRSRKTLSQRRIDKPLLAKNVWCTWSDILEVEVPSVMKHSETFTTGDWIKFKHSNRFTDRGYKWSYGTIKEIKSPGIYNIEHYLSQNEYVIMNATDEWIKCCPAANYVDISCSMDSDLMLLVGDRMGVDTQNIEDIYNELYQCFYDKYACKIFKKRGPRLNNVVLASMAQCVAFNVMDFLCMNKEKVYKIRCCINNKMKLHYDNTLQLMSTRSYQINQCRMLREFERMDFWFYCHICLCRQGGYGWMFRCQFDKSNKYYGHDICLTCVHDMVEGYNKLNQLLEDALKDELSTDCIQIISSYAIGHVIKHSSY